VALELDDGVVSSLMALFGMMRDSEMMRISRLECNAQSGILHSTADSLLFSGTSYG
jgi:hypothetical protein